MTVESAVAVDEAFRNTGLHHRQGRFRQAAALYQGVLQERPGHLDALHMLGLVLHQNGQDETAVELIGRAIPVETEEATRRPERALLTARVSSPR